jgi:hypothetical protein
VFLWIATDNIVIVLKKNYNKPFLRVFMKNIDSFPSSRDCDSFPLSAMGMHSLEVRQKYAFPSWSLGTSSKTRLKTEYADNNKR